MREWQKAQRRRPAYCIPSLPKLASFGEKSGCGLQLALHCQTHARSRGRSPAEYGRRCMGIIKLEMAPISIHFARLLSFVEAGSSTRCRACPASKTGPARGTVLVPADGNCSGPGFSVLKLRHAFIHAFVHRATHQKIGISLGCVPRGPMVH